MTDEFGTVWKDTDGSFWDWMWERHKDAKATKEMLARAYEFDLIYEVGCGHGHFLSALIDLGWAVGQGTSLAASKYYVGFDFSEQGCSKTTDIIGRGGVNGLTECGDFMEHHEAYRSWQTQMSRGASPRIRPVPGIAVAHDVVIHLPHYLPMAMAMLTIADVAVLGIGYLDTKKQHHVSLLREKGHYDTTYSRDLIDKELRATGLWYRINTYENEIHGRTEAVVEIARSPYWPPRQ